MTKKLYFLILIFFIPFCQLFASHAVGADLTYDCLGGNTYRFRLKFYRDCAGIAAPTSVSINIASTSCSRSTSITMPLISSQEVSPLCAAQLPNSTCNGGSLPGIQQYIYEATYTLPANCPDWRFSYTLCCRNVAVTNSNNASSYNLYVEAMLNNQVVTCNSSPDFTVNPVPYICNGQPFSYNHGVVDVDGDSLSYTLIQPKHTATSNVPYSGSFTSTYPISTSPPNNFVFNPSTGQMTFTPGSTQIGLVAIRVDEFRNGVKIGSTIRDMQVIVINCGTNSTPSMANPINITGATYNTVTSTFKACPGTPMSFQFVSSDLDASQILTLTSNVGTSIPAAVVTSTGTNPKTTTFTWTPTMANAGFYSISFRAVDNACPLTASVTKGFNIYVPSLRGSISDTMVCTGTGKAFNLNATPTGTDGTETYAWTPNVGFTTSSTIKNPSVNISAPQTYVVSMTQGGCILRDTVRVKPYATLVASPDSSLCPFDPAIQLTSSFTKLMPTLSASPITYSWTPTAGLTPSATISNPSAKPAATTSYILSAGDALCTMKDTVMISVVPCPCYDTARIATPKVLTCAQLLDTLDGSASTTGSSFQWIAYAGGNIVSGATTSQPIINQPGRYTLVITNLINGCVDSTFVIVTRNITAPNINAGIDTVLNCVRTSLNLNATSSTTGATFAWSNGATTATTNVNAPNTYTVTATNPTNGCTASDAVVVTQNITTPNINAGIDTVLNCVRTSLNLNATSSTTGVTYVWSNGATTASTSVNTPNTYTVTVTNTYNRCTASDAVVVTQNVTAPIANAGVDTILYCNRTTINWSATSNVAGATYAWSNGATTAANTTTVPNTYTVTVTNPLNGCTASDAMVISQNITAPIANAGVDTILYCNRTTINWSATSNVAGATYAWSNGSTTAANTTTVPNTYTVTVTNPLNGCTASDAMVISQNITAPVANAGVDTILYCNRTTINWSATSNVAGATYAWSNGATTAANTTTVPNIYTVTVTNPLNGCTASDAMVISQNITAPIANAGVDTILYCNRTTINWSATSNVAGATYVWSNGATTAANTTTVPNTYTVTVTNPLNGCTASDAMVISQNITAPVANAGVDTILYCNRTTINWSATSNVAGATYAWSNGSTTAANTTTVPNTYTVTVTNPLNGCTASDAMVISQNITAPIANAGVDTILYCNRTTINWSATSNVAGATYVWSNGSTTAANTTTVPNTYTVTVTNPLNGCTASDAMVISQNITAPVANAGVDTILYCNRTTINWSATSNVAGATYAWSNGATTAANTTTVPNTYTVTVTNPSNGCTASDAMVISQNITAPIANAGVDTILYCNRTTINWSATSNVAGATYAWSNGSTTAANTTTVPNTYTVTVTNPLNGCTASDAMVISQNITAPVANAGVDTILYCNRTTINWSATSNVAGATYAWSNGATTAANTTTVPNTYTVTVTNPLNGCTASDAMVISQNITAPIANAGVDTILYCNRTTINWSATSNVAGATYVWSNGATTAANTTTVPNTYTVTVTNPLNGCTASDAMVISQNITAPVANAGVDTILYCNRTTINWSATSNVAGATYAWSNGATTAANTTTVPNTYTVTVTNPLNGCTASDAMVIVQDLSIPNINAGIDTVLNCVRTSLNLNATSSTTGVTFEWSNGATTSVANVSLPNTYTVTATDPLNGCTASDAVVVTQNLTAPIANAGVDTILYCNRTTINWTATSNVAGATYAWSNGSTTAANTTTVPNTYTVTVTNPYNGCTANDAMVISQNLTAPGVNAGIDTVVNCVRTSLNLSATSSTSGATFAWSNGANTAVTNVSVPTTYTVTATHPINGCTSTDAVVVGIDTVSPNANAGVDTVINCTNPTISLLGSSSTYGVTVAWTGPGIVSGANTYSPVVNDAGLYTMTITNVVSGCVTTDGVNVSANFIVPNAEAGNLDSVTCSDVQINLQGSSITSNVSYSWSGPGIVSGANTSSPLVNTAGLYTLTVTSLTNGCSKTDTVSVIQEITTPQVSAGADTTLTCVRTNLNLTATSSTPSPIGFAWSNGATTAVTNVNTNNTYTVTATNLINGCTVSDAVVVSMDTVSPGVNAGIDTVVNCVRTSLNLSATSSTSGATFAWSNGANTAVTNVSVPTTYTVTATHPINGCTSTDAVVVGIDTVSPNANAGVDTVINCTNPTISLLGSSSTYGVTVAWTGPGIVSGANTYSPVVNDAGLYTMTITNVVSGCVTTDGVNVSANFIVPNAEAGNLDSVTCADVQINLQGSSITSNVSYSWSGPGIVSGANTSSPLVNTAGLYTLTVTSLTNGCSKTDTVSVIQEITTPQVSAGADTTLTCVRTNLNLTATSSTPSPIGFAWSNGATTAVTNVNTNNTYTVTATNLINGCTVSDAVVVSMDTVSPGVNAGIDTVVNCVRTSLNLSATSSTSGATFAWSNGANTAVTNVSVPTTYTVTATHPINGCTSTDAVVVGIDTVSPNANAGVDTVINCTNPTISLLGSSSTYGVTVAWTGPGIVSGANTYSPVVNDAGLYTMTITNVVSGCVTTDGVNVSANFIVPNAEAGNLDSVTCSDVQINLQGSSITSNVSYSWSGPGIVSGANTSSPLVNTAGLYTLTVTSLTNGCSKTDTVSVIQEITTPQVSAGADTTLTCVRTNLNLTATSSTPSPIGFAWSNGATTAVTNVNTNNTYTVTATNLINGCTVSDAVVVSMDTVSPGVNAGLDTILNCVRRNLSLQASSNIAGATYQWSNGVSGIMNPITTPNIYRVTATHPGNGCVSTDAVIVVIDTTTPDINAGLDTTIKCYRRSVVLNATSSVPNMNYVWSNGTVGASNTVSAANMYTVIGQNPVNGCVNRDAVIVNIDTVAPNANAGPDKIVNCIKTSETLNASSTTPNVTYLWSNGTTTAANTVSTTIAYTVTVTNPFNGCTASDVAVLTPDTVAPGANAGADKDLTCTITSVSFTATSPTANVSFQWSNGITGQNITVSIPNTYAVTVTSLGNGCTSTDAVNANLVPPPTITYDVLDNPCPQVAKGHIVPMISGGKAPFTYTWNNGSHASALSGLHGGGYAVTITDANGCVITDTFNLVEKQFILDVTADQTEIELGEEVHFNSNITGGTGMESITWNPGIFLSCDTCKNPTAGPMKSVKYNIVAVDTNGCSSTDTISIQVTPKYDLFVPNAFSPNNDGSNDVYEIFGNKKIWAEVEFKIFNRWGELIFESRDHEFKWDGTFKGEMLTPQVVVYEFKVVYVDGYSAPTQKGSITLIR